MKVLWATLYNHPWGSCPPLFFFLLVKCVFPCFMTAIFFLWSFLGHVFSFFFHFGLSRGFLLGSCHLGQGFSFFFGPPCPPLPTQWHIAIQLPILFPKGRWEHCMMNISKVAHNGWLCSQLLILSRQILTYYATFLQVFIHLTNFSTC
jgi:hypothetical protein